MHRTMRYTRRAVPLALMVATVVALATTAWGHVTVRPGSAERGAFEILNFSVPNESDTASTVGLEVTFPTETPIPSVRVQPKPGWTYSVERTQLPEPIDLHGSELTEVVSKISWTGGEIKPGEFDLFAISVGPLPEKGKELLFPALQIYSDGTEVNWNEKTPPSGEEPEHPAPVLKLTKPKGGGH
jgi:uncharacterized protein